jgi:hypothetical protein
MSDPRVECCTMSASTIAILSFLFACAGVRQALERECKKKNAFKDRRDTLPASTLLRAE